MGWGRTQTDRATEKDPRMSEAPERDGFVMGQRRETGPLRVFAEAQQNPGRAGQRAQPQREALTGTTPSAPWQNQRFVDGSAPALR